MRRPEVNIDHAALVAMGVIAVSWFLIATLVVNFGLWQQSIRLYDVWVVIHEPAGRLNGLNRSDAFTTLGFGLVGAAAALAPLTPMFYRRKLAWLTDLVPCTLMAVSFAVLYTRTSTSSLHTDSNAHSVSAYLAHIAQGAATRASGLAATLISIGAGAYIAALGSCYLAIRGVSRFRAASRGPTPTPTA
jgi:hypothetical protein